MRFKVGDLVHLKSGSPKMVVTAVGLFPGDLDNDIVTVVWCGYGSSQIGIYTGPGVAFVPHNDHR